MSHRSTTFTSMIYRALTIMSIGIWSSGLGAVTAEEALEQLEQRLTKCTDEFGYDPDRTQDIGPQELALNELEWRSCAYRAIETLMIPNTEVPQVYQQIIDEDRSMTNKILNEEMTRAEREARLDILIASIKDQEEKAKSVRRMKLRTIQNVQRSIMRLR